MKLNTQTKYFINGIILLFLGLLCATFVPLNALSVEKYIYLQVEFFLLCASAIYYLFSPKYYPQQILSIFIGILYYFLFVKIFS